MNQAITDIHLHQARADESFKNNSFLLKVFICLSFWVLFTCEVQSQGVIAGTDIANTVIVNYQIAGSNQLPIESTPTGNSTPGLGNGSPTIFKVDRKIDLLVTGNNNANVAPGDSQAEVTFTLTNEGNDNQEFSLIPDNSLVTDDFDPNTCNYLVTAVSGTPLIGVIVPTSGNIKLKPDQQASISVKCNIPFTSNGLPLQTGQTSLLSLIATAERNDDGSLTSESIGADISTSVQTVFADSAGSDDANRDANHSARRNYLVSTSGTPPTLSINKSIISIADSLGGSTAVSGSEVTYRIQITTGGAGFINNLVVTDPTPANMNYKAATIELNSAAQSDANDGVDNTDFGITTANTATINLGSIAAGSSHEIQLTYIIN